MAEPNLIEQERGVVREFLKTATSRANDEAGLEADFNQKRQAAQSALEQTRRQADDAKNEVQELHEEAQTLLAKKRVGQGKRRFRFLEPKTESGVQPDSVFFGTGQH